MATLAELVTESLEAMDYTTMCIKKTLPPPEQELYDQRHKELMERAAQRVTNNLAARVKAKCSLIRPVLGDAGDDMTKDVIEGHVREIVRQLLTEGLIAKETIKVEVGEFSTGRSYYWEITITFSIPGDERLVTTRMHVNRLL